MRFINNQRVALILAWTISTSKLVSGAWYKDYYPQASHYCVYGCKIAAPYITFNIPVATNFDVGQCTNDLKLQSIYACGQAYCSPQEFRAGIGYLNAECLRNAGMELPSAESLMLSPSKLDNVTRLDVTTALATATAPLDTLAIPDQMWHALAARTINAFWSNWNIGFMFAWGMYGFWGLVLAIGIINRLLQGFKSGQQRRAASAGGGKGLWLWIRRRLILSATFGHHCQDPLGWCTIPPRLETLTISAYIIMVFIMCFPGYDLFVGNQYWATSSVQITRYISDRTGFLAIAQLPIVWVFAARNDPFLWLTGWSYATYNRFHRGVARLTVILAVVHSVGYSIFSGFGKTWTVSWTTPKPYWFTGVMATIVMSLMLGISVYWFRQKAYDLFLVIHIFLAVISLVTIYFHINKNVTYVPQQFYGFIWPCVAMWALDRALRIARVFNCSILPQLSRNARAVASYNSQTRMIRLEVTDFLGSEIVPGLVYYLYTPGSMKGYESHPFTLCSWRPLAVDALREPAGKTEGGTVNNTVPSTTHNVSHTFLLRPYPGNSFTGRLQKQLEAAQDSESGVSTKNLTVLLEGPYRECLDLSNYSDVLFICGGSGITPAISHAHHLTSTNTTTKVHIHWAVPQRAFVDDVCANELASVLGHERLELVVYLASGSSKLPEKAIPEANLVNGEDAAGSQQKYKTNLGRPDIEMIMRDRRADCSGSLAVVGCGTPQMADAFRAAVVKLLGEDGPNIDYYNETMTW